MLGDFGEVLVMDWGLAKRVGGDRSQGAGIRSQEIAPAVVADPRAENLTPDSRPLTPSAATLAGTIMGTPQFMAPEQARGEIERIDARSDIYSLGAILYQILALRVSVTGADAMEVVGKVGRGEIEPLISPESKIQNSKSKISESLAAVVRKAMSLGRTGRYQSVADFQRDIEAYQGGFATDAEKAGKWKRLTLFVKRNKAASLGVAAVLVLIVGFTAKVIAEGRRAEREAARAKAALADLKASAPDLLALAASEAGLQRYESALKKADAALALDPSLAAARWRRAWVLVAQEKLPEALEALRVAADKDPANRRFAALLPLVEKMAAAPADKRHEFENIKPLYDHLTAVGAVGEATPLLPHLKLGSEARLKLVKDRLEQRLRKAAYSVGLNNGHLKVNLDGIQLGSLELLRGLPIEVLLINGCGIRSFEPLRGMHLIELQSTANGVGELDPLQGMPLEKALFFQMPIHDLSALRGMPLKTLGISESGELTDLSPLAGIPIEDLSVSNSASSDFSALRGMPLRRFRAVSSRFTDGRILSGAPLADLDLAYGLLSNLATLIGLPLRNLRIPGCPITDLTPLLRIPTLESLETNAPRDKLLPLRAHPGLKQIKLGDAPYRPVAEFWADYDAQQAAK